jgi:carbamate kinase
MKRIVIALGGNAIQQTKEQTSAAAQQQVITQTVRFLLDLAEHGFEMVLTHGNGPQVGTLLLQQQAGEAEGITAMPLDTCGAMSQGMIGYWMQQAFIVEMAKRHIQRSCATVVTQTEVSATDPAFQNPTKPIGPFYSQDQAKALSNTNGYIMKEDAGRGWRRVVASPRPINILEFPVIRDLTERGHIVISTGGGGVPVVRNADGTLHGVEAVIDKDLGGALLAEGIGASIYLILTAVDEVAINFHTPQQQNLQDVSTDELRAYIKEGHFAPGSMLPKVEAAIKFAESGPGHIAIITSLEKAPLALQGKAGTHVRASRYAAEREQRKADKEHTLAY